MAERDLGYKRLFAHRELVADLLTGFIREPWVAEVELETLERVSGSYVSDRWCCTAIRIAGRPRVTSVS